jgi:hypothetical protein
MDAEYAARHSQSSVKERGCDFGCSLKRDASPKANQRSRFGMC